MARKESIVREAVAGAADDRETKEAFPEERKNIIKAFLKKSLIVSPEGGYAVIAISEEEERWLKEEDE